MIILLAVFAAVTGLACYFVERVDRRKRRALREAQLMPAE